MNRAPNATVGSATGCENFRRWLVNTRKKNNETQGSLAIDIDMDRKSVIAFESGARIPGLDDVLRIAEHYGLSSITISLKDDSITQGYRFCPCCGVNLTLVGGTE